MLQIALVTNLVHWPLGRAAVRAGGPPGLSAPQQEWDVGSHGVLPHPSCSSALCCTQCSAEHRKCDVLPCHAGLWGVRAVIF